MPDRLQKQSMGTSNWKSHQLLAEGYSYRLTVKSKSAYCMCPNLIQLHNYNEISSNTYLLLLSSYGIFMVKASCVYYKLNYYMYVLHTVIIIASLCKGKKDTKQETVYARNDIYQLFSSRSKTNNTLFILWHYHNIAASSFDSNFT